MKEGNYYQYYNTGQNYLIYKSFVEILATRQKWKLAPKQVG